MFCDQQVHLADPTDICMRNSKVKHTWCYHCIKREPLIEMVGDARRLV